MSKNIASHFENGTEFTPTDPDQFNEPDMDYGPHHGRQTSFYETEMLRGTEIIGMDMHGMITAAKTEEKRIATLGLGGCTGVAVTAEYADGTRVGFIQHYSPISREVSSAVLDEATDYMAQARKPVSASAVIMTPGDWSRTSKGTWEMKAMDESLTQTLSMTAWHRLGAGADIQVYPYSEEMEDENYAQGTLVIDFGRDGNTTILAEAIPMKPAES